MHPFKPAFVVLAVLLAMLVRPMPALAAFDFPQPVIDEIAAMPFEPAGHHSLARSNGSVVVPDQWVILADESARRLLKLTEAMDFPLAEAVTLKRETEEIFLFEFEPSGYVSLDDWSDLDPDALLAEVSKTTEDANPAKVRQGIPELHVVGWEQRPYLDRKTATAYWGIRVAQGDWDGINYAAVKLGRRGFEKITWAGTYKLYPGAGVTMQTMLASHRFDDGYRYADFSAGDKLAAFGIASLVATAAGGAKASKGAVAAFFAAVGLILKKYIVAIGVAIAGLFGFRRKGKKGAAAKDGSPDAPASSGPESPRGGDEAPR